MAVPIAPHLGGAQLRSLEKVLEDAHMTGILNLSGRNIRDYPKSADNFELLDTMDVDISKNRFTEIPDELCEYSSLERLNCYNNAIRTVPQSFALLRRLTYLNLSRNLLSALPIEICRIHLEVLIVSNNKLVALPPAVGEMTTLMHLDASCNELDTLPMQIGKMESLKELNLRRNHLVHLPEDISRLSLVMLDVSCNKISVIPPSYRHIKTLDVLKLEHNPLELPPAQVCTRGKVHIFKYLHNVATKDEKRSRLEQSERLSRRSYNNAKFTWLTTHEAATRFGSSHNNHQDTSLAGNQSVVLSPSTLTAQYTKRSEDSNDSPRSSTLTPQSSIDSDSSHSTLCNGDFSMVEDFAFWNAKIGELRRGTLMADSGYIDGDKRWSATEPSKEDEEAQILAERANQQKEHRQQREDRLNQSLSNSSLNNSSFGLDNEPDIDYIDTGDSIEDGEITPTQTEPDEFTKVKPHKALIRQKAIYEDQKLKAREERVRKEQEEKRKMDEGRRRAERGREIDHERYRRSSPSGSLLSVHSNGSAVGSGLERNQKPRPLSSSSFSESLQRPTTLEIARQKRQQRRATVNVMDNIRSSSVDRNSFTRSTSSHSSTLPNGRLPSTIDDNKRALKRTDKMTSASAMSLAPPSTHAPSSHAPSTHAPSSHAPGSSRDNGISPSRHEAQLARRRLEEEKARTKQIQKDAVRNFVHIRNSTSSLTSPTREEPDPLRDRSSVSVKSPPPSNSGSAFSSIKPRSAFSLSSKPLGEVQPNFTVKREMTKYKEEMDRIEQLRKLKPNWMSSYKSMSDINTIDHMTKCIETRLKVSLPDDIPGALEDGVVLCHFMNNVCPHAVPTIHVPSPAVPKLSAAKCARNVENFLKACSTAGVPGEKLCTVADILEGKGLVKVASTVQALLANNSSQHKLSSAV